MDVAAPDAEPHMSDMPSTCWTLTARWVFPVDGPPLERGVVVIDGERIVARRAARRAAPPTSTWATPRSCPGLVNAHTHLDLTGLRGAAPPSPDFTALAAAGDRSSAATARRSKYGPTSGRVWPSACASARRCSATFPATAAAGTRWRRRRFGPWSSARCSGLPEGRAPPGVGRDSTAGSSARTATPTCRPGVSPHAPYSVRSSLFLGRHDRRRSRRRPPGGNGGGAGIARPSAAGRSCHSCKDLGVWDPDGLAEDADHVLRLFNGLHPTLFVHGNYLAPTARFPPTPAIVYCPRTHAAFGHPPHPFREFLARGVRVALGTDSLASNPDLDMLAEARFVHRTPSRRARRRAAAHGDA